MIYLRNKNQKWEDKKEFFSLIHSESCQILVACLPTKWKIKGINKVTDRKGCASNTVPTIQMKVAHKFTATIKK